MAENKAHKPAEAPQKSRIAKREEEILAFWQEKEIFKKTLEKESPKGEFVFYDGPPFATGLPHMGNILAGTMKDYIGRYRTMRGYHVPRRWGWDCHGLPVENIVEKEIGLKSKKDIEEFGIEKFNDIARSKVFAYVDDWKRIIPRMGRFVDMENDYRTMNPTFTESVWWVFKELHQKGLVYEGFKAMHICPHCGTTLANFEVSQGYKDITDISVTAKFELGDEPGAYLLAWTTTPWTLPGNVALAVNPNVDYVKIKVGDEKFILAESRLSVVKDAYEELERMPGSALVDLSYKPLFDYYKGVKLENRERGWKVYAADFVTTEDGTGIVHIAPAFGEDDMNLGKKERLPFIQHVGMDGAFKKEVTDFAGMKVKPIENPQAADIEVLKFLAAEGKIFAKEKFTHSYPHCYRCDTPLLNYATSSWFVEVTKIKDKLLAANGNVSWVPREIGEGRFAKWIDGARDWAISRSRFWGASMPVWKCDRDGCGETAFLGSVEEIKERTSRGNTFWVARHGEAESNVEGILSSNPKTVNHLTAKGREQAAAAANNLEGKKIDVIYSSPFMRTRETAEIIAEAIGYPKEDIVYDERLHEIYGGVFDGKTDAEYQAFFGSRFEKFWKTPEGGENYAVVKRRITAFLYDTDAKHAGKHILIVGHNTPIWLLFSGAAGLDEKQTVATRTKQNFIENSEIRRLPFSPIPHNRDYELDLHRPFIDEIVFACSCGGTMRRIPDVFDCWFESGSMPYGEMHYPFEHGDLFDPSAHKRFPADFIAEGLDQTRGWFYTMLIIATALFGESSYRNVIVNGLVLAEDGKKMSKHLHNYTDPLVLADRYGADAMRYYMLSSPVTEAEDLKFSDKGVDEVLKKVIMRLENVYSFFEMYGGFDADEEAAASANVLDRWILARLAETAAEVTKATDAYELDRAARPINDFVDDLSTWYLRRSRDRFKSEDSADRYAAMRTTKAVIRECSKLIAPSMPFLADDLYRKITGGMAAESVHLAAWPDELARDLSAAETEAIELMRAARAAVSAGLELRAKAGIKVRQPLAKLTLKSPALAGKDAYAALIRDEVNVKTIAFDPGLAADAELDTALTDELREEGLLRDVVRAVQELRKKKGLKPGEPMTLAVETDASGRKFFDAYRADIAKATSAKTVVFEAAETAEYLDVDGLKLKLAIK